MTVPSRKLSCADISEILLRQADLEERFLQNLAEQVLPSEMERLRPEQAEDLIVLIAALRAAGEAFKGFANLPASMQLVLGVLK